MAARASPQVRRVLVTLALGAIVLVTLLFVWYARDILLLAFAGVLFAVFLRSPATWLSARTPLPVPVSLAIVALSLVGLLTLAFWLHGSAIGEEAAALRERLPQAAEQLKERLAEHELGRRAIEQAPDPGTLLPDTESAVQRATGVVSRTFSMLANFAIILFIGLVVAGGPRPYVEGIVALVPSARQERAREIIAAVVGTMRWWLLGRLISMATVGVLTWLGLWLLGIPLAFVLALLAALLSFIPNLGPILSAMPAILLGLAESPRTALYVALLYMAVQAFESWVIDPIIDRKTVYLPPALVILAQLTMALIGGLLGVALATPLIAVFVVIVKMLYIEDTLGQPVSETR